MAIEFQLDVQVAEIADAYALDAIDIAANNFSITLDWSEGSVRLVEQMLGRLHDEMVAAQPSQDAIWRFAKAFGSYVGEVLRRSHGAEWGTVTMDGNSFPGMRQTRGGLCWPWGRAHKRLVVGPEENIWHYYSALIPDSA